MPGIAYKYINKCVIEMCGIRRRTKKKVRLCVCYCSVAGIILWTRYLSKLRTCMTQLLTLLVNEHAVSPPKTVWNSFFFLRPSDEQRSTNKLVKLVSVRGRRANTKNCQTIHDVVLCLSHRSFRFTVSVFCC